jgi:hypothetical protein
MSIEIPSDDEVVDVLRGLERSSDGITARALCNALIAKGHPIRESQIAIQRAVERDRVQLNSDWTLNSINEKIAA